MKRIQLNRATVFAKRLVKVFLSHRTPARQQRLIEEIETFFSLIEGYEEHNKRRHGTDKYKSWDQQGQIYDTFNEFFDEQHYHVSDHYSGRNKKNQYYHYHANRFFDDLQFCVRAAVNVVCPDQRFAGCLGVKAGDIRKMYPRCIPAWLNKKEYVPWESEEGAPGQHISEMPDEMGIAL